MRQNPHVRICGGPGSATTLVYPTAGEGESDFYFVPAEDPEQAVERILTLVRERIPRRFGLDPVRDIQVLCPMNGVVA